MKRLAVGCARRQSCFWSSWLIGRRSSALRS
jgi:hypothetical protein